MSKLHILKNSENEAVVKVYTDESSGESIDISLEDDLTTSKQVYVTGTASIDESATGGYATYTGSHAIITGFWYGCKKDKQVNVQRIISTGPDVLHGFAYFLNSGFQDYRNAGFADRIYANKDIRVTFDGPGFIIIRMSKSGWNPKVETATFGIYDDETAVGS